MEDKAESDSLLKAELVSQASNAVDLVKNKAKSDVVRLRKKAAEFGENGRAEFTLGQGNIPNEANLVSETALLNDFVLLILAATTSLTSDAARLAYLQTLMAQTLAGNPPAFVDCSEESYSSATIEAAKSRRNPNPFNYPNPSLFESVRAGEIRRRGIDVDVNFTHERKVRLFKAAIGGTRNAVLAKMEKEAAKAAAAAAESEGGE